MDDSRHPLPDYYEAALQASCDALIALEVARALCPDVSSMKGRTAASIRSLRCTIMELRDAASGETTAPASGFVLGRSALLPVS